MNIGRSLMLAIAALSCAAAPLDASARVLRNSTLVSQQGSNNAAAIAQNGAGNAAGIVQRGDNNSGAITQNGNDHYACLYQRGNNLDGAIAQSGNGQQLTVVQTERWTRTGTDRVVIGRTGVYRCR